MALLLGFLLATACADSLAAQSRGSGGDSAVEIRLPDDRPSDLLRRELYDRWFRWRGLLESGDLASVEPLRQEILTLLDQSPVRGVEILAGATARLGYTLMEAGRLEEAGLAFAFARDLQPDLPQVHYGLGQLALAEKDPIGWFRHSIKGFLTQFKGMWGSFFLQTNLLLVVLGTLLLFGGGFATVQMFKHQRVFRHTVAERLAGRLTPDVGAIVGLGVLVLPLLLWLGPIVLFLWWIGLLYAYMGARERTGAWIACVGMAVMPLILTQLHDRASYLDNPILRAVQGMEAGDVPARTIQELEQQVALDPDAIELRFLYARALSRAGRGEEARSQYREITEQDPGRERAWLNLGNTYFRESDYDVAVPLYQKAIETGGCYALAHYNLAIAYQNLLESPLYQEQIQAARTCDSELVDDLTDLEGVADAELEPEEIMALVHIGQAEEAPPSMRAAFLNPLTALALAVLVWMAARQIFHRGGSPAKACTKCGRPFCNACQPGAEASAYCTQCLHLYIKKDGVAPAVRVQKAKEVERHASRARWFGRLLNALLPGSASLLGDRVTGGIVVLVLWSFLLAILILGGRFVEYPQQVLDAPSSAFAASIFFLLGVVWVCSNVLPLVTRR